MVIYPSQGVLFNAVILLILCQLDAKVSLVRRQQQQHHHIPSANSIYPGYMDSTVCRTVPGLTKEQVDLCRRQPDAATAAVLGMDQAVAECQRQFQGHRWNCSSLATKGGNPYISAILKKGYKETAFAHAITAAGVAIAVAKSCSAGLLANCGCDSKPYKTSAGSNSWKWGGCSHNLRHGLRFSRMFLDAREKLAEDIRSKVNLHNNQVGRMAVSNNMQVKCKCHGMSGSCELKTCWRAVPDYRIVGKALKEKFRSAVLVDQTSLGKKNIRKFNAINLKKKQPPLRTKNWQRPRNKKKRDLSRDLLYYQKSPNFCERDRALDVPGTSGRPCNRTSAGPDGCSDLCCGRGYDLVKRRRVERCHCKFVWCCQVECQTCGFEDWISVCK